MTSLPAFNDAGDLPPGIYALSLEAVLTHFGTGSPQRVLIASRLSRIYVLAKGTGHLARFIIFGSLSRSSLHLTMLTSLC